MKREIQKGFAFILLVGPSLLRADCTKNNLHQLRGKLQELQRVLISEGTQRYSFEAQKNLSLLGQSLFSLSNLKGEVLFDAKSRIYLESLSYSLLVEESDAFEIVQSGAKSDYTYYSRVDTAPLAFLVDIFRVDTKNEFSLANRFDQNWKCLSLSQEEAHLEVTLEPRKAISTLERLRIRFSRHSLDSVSIEVFSNSLTSMSLALKKLTPHEGVTKEIPFHLRIPAGASFNKF